MKIFSRQTRETFHEGLNLFRYGRQLFPQLIQILWMFSQVSTYTCFKLIINNKILRGKMSCKSLNFQPSALEISDQENIIIYNKTLHVQAVTRKKKK